MILLLYPAMLTVLMLVRLSRSIQMQLHFSVDLTGNESMIEKSELSGTWINDFPIFSQTG